MSLVKRTELYITASQSVQNVYTLHPSIATTFVMNNGTSNSTHRVISEGHIQYFTAIQFQLTTDTQAQIHPVVVLDYRPLTKVSILIETP